MELLDAFVDPNPSAAVVGSSTSANVYNFDVEATAGLADTDNGVAIQAALQTKYFKVASPGANKMLLRVYPELFLAGPLNSNLTVSFNYGNGTGATASLNVAYSSLAGGSLWDVGLWDVALWDQAAIVSFISPTSRLDFPGNQFENVAFGITTTGASGQWTYQGLSLSLATKIPKPSSTSTVYVTISRPMRPKTGSTF